jgi:hypothetical protein
LDTLADRAIRPPARQPESILPELRSRAVPMSCGVSLPLPGARAGGSSPLRSLAPGGAYGYVALIIK